MTDPNAEADAGQPHDARAAFGRSMVARLLGPAAPFLADPGVSEIMINGPDEIWVERDGRLDRAPGAFQDAAAVEALARAMLQQSGRSLEAGRHSFEARLYDGSRVHVMMPPAARPQRLDPAAAAPRPGPCIAIRKFAARSFTLEDLVAAGSMSAAQAGRLRDAVHPAAAGERRALNILVSGGTGSGKTTLLNALGAAMPVKERIIVIEDASELRLPGAHVLQFESTPPDRHGRGGATIRELFRGALRMRPDRIIVGECRGGEALDMIQAMTSGHDGSLSTIHANSPDGALRRLETLCLMSEAAPPLAAVRRQIAEAIDLVVQVERRDGKRRVTAVAGIELSADGEGWALSPADGPAPGR